MLRTELNGFPIWSEYTKRAVLTDFQNYNHWTLSPYKLLEPLWQNTHKLHISNFT
jgi:hypothetical protein